MNQPKIQKEPANKQNKESVDTTPVSAKKSSFRWTISIQMYLGLATFVLLIFMASFLGWKSILEMNDIQKTITQQRIPELSLAIRMSQESVALMNTAPKLLAANSEEKIKEISSLIHYNAENLSQVLKQLKETHPDGKSPVFAKYESLSQDLISNLKILETSVGSTLRLKTKLNTLLNQALAKTRSINKALISEVDEQTFFLYTGWNSLNQKSPTPLHQRANKNSLNYYRSLLSLKAQSQLASNLLNQATQLSNPDLIQPLRERFQAALGNCKQSLLLMENNAFKNKIFQQIETLEKAGLGKQSDKSQKGLFELLEEVFKKKQLQNKYLSNNQDVVRSLSTQTEQLIKDIQNAGLETTRIFEETALQKKRQFSILNLVSIILAFSIGFFLVGRHFIGRVKRLSQTILTMSKGNLEVPLNLKGNDEITDIGKAMEIFRQYAIEAQKLNLVQKLAREVQEKNNELEGAIAKLKTAQKQIIMQEKLASLGQLTSGIAHEIKNPLNFINNFSQVSQELLEDLSRELVEPENNLTERSRSFIEDTLRDLHGNMNKINTHGKRANDIITGMLQHSRTRVEDTKESIQFNRFLDSCVNLAYHGKRSSGSNFNVDFKKDYSEEVQEVEVNPQDISRVILNLVTNACDAVEEKASKLSVGERENYNPCIWVQTSKNQNHLEVQVSDNGPGIPEEKTKKVFDPFYTTKPTDKGTGLGLSLSHDIIVKHGGTLKLGRSKEGGAVFTIQLPLKSLKKEGADDSLKPSNVEISTTPQQESDTSQSIS